MIQPCVLSVASVFVQLAGVGSELGLKECFCLSLTFGRWMIIGWIDPFCLCFPITCHRSLAVDGDVGRKVMV